MMYKVCFKWPEMPLFSELFYSLLKENVNIQQNLSIIGAHAEGESFPVAASTFPGGGLFRKIFPLLLLPPGLFFVTFTLSF